MSNYYDLFNELLDEKIEDNSTEKLTERTPRDYLSEENIRTVENNITFFQDIPQQDIKNVLEELIRIIFKYERNKPEKYAETLDFIRKYREIKKTTNREKVTSSIVFKELKKEKAKKPIQKIKQDILLIEKYQSMLERLFTIAKSRTNNEYGYLNVPKEIIGTHKINNKLLYELKKKEFNLISRIKYYKWNYSTKNNLKDYLNTLVKKYNLEKVYDYKKPLIDEIV